MAVIGLLSSSTQPRQELPAQGSQYIARLIRPDAPDRGREPRPKPWKPCSPRERLPAARSFAIAIHSCSSLDSPYLLRVVLPLSGAGGRPTDRKSTRLNSS